MNEKMRDIARRRAEVTKAAEQLATDITELLLPLVGTTVSVTEFIDDHNRDDHYVYIGVLRDLGNGTFMVGGFIFHAEEISGFEMNDVLLIKTFWFEWEH